MDIKPIETVYNGYRFRSRLEARWAVFFDALGWEYEYEAEGYELEGVRYLPDFYFRSISGFVEIKGQSPKDEEKEKARLLSLGGFDVMILYPNGDAGFDLNRTGVCTYSSGELADEVYQEIFTLLWGLQLAKTKTIGSALDKIQAGDYSECEQYARCLRRAENKARQARFEHGANGR